MRTRAHDPIDVTVDTVEDHLPDVLSALATWGHELVDSPHPGRIRVVVPVTNTDALMVRLAGLGRRVWLVGPDAVRDAFRDRLLSVGGPR